MIEDGGLLTSLTPLRAELLRGDRRVAYLAWLLAAQAGELDPDTPEPWVPHGLDTPSASLAALTSFLRVDPDLLAAAAEAVVEDADELGRFRSWVARLPAREQQRWLLRADNLDLAVGWALLGGFRRAHPAVAATGTHRGAVAGPGGGTARRARLVPPAGATTRIATLRPDAHRTGSPRHVSRVMVTSTRRQARRTTFVERLLGALGGWVLAVRCRRSGDPGGRENPPPPEIRGTRYRAAGASTTGGSPSRRPGLRRQLLHCRC